MLPVALEGSCPLVQRANGFGVGAVELVAAVAAHPNQSHVAQDAEVLGDGGLLEAEGCDDLLDGPLGPGEIAEDLAATGLGYCLEGVGGGACSCPDGTIHAYMGICQVRVLFSGCQ